ncbi:MAG: hypothetical protein LUD72_14085 [Bacteroidales bacterium]|nr:hypothetical protein [Bacteroidales bacterium]
MKTEKSKNEKPAEADFCGFFYEVGQKDTMTSIVSQNYGLNEKTAVLVKLIADLNEKKTISVSAGDVIYLPDRKRALEYCEYIYNASQKILEIRKQKKVAEILQRRKVMK